MAELESIMNKLESHRQRLQEPQRAQDDRETLMVEGLALMSEALLKVGRDVRYIRNHLAERG